MTRPQVSISIANQINRLLQHLEGMLPKFKELPDVEGITLNGGLSRGYADHLSEIDITFYLNEVTYKKWQNEKAPIPLGIVKFDRMLYDIKIINLEDEFQRQYCDIELWDLSYAKVLYDPDHKISELVEKKLSTKPHPSKADDLLWESYWYYRLAGDIWVNREDILQGAFTLNEAIKPLIKALFIANGEYVPHEKWLVHMSRTLNRKPHNWEEKIMVALGYGDFTLNGLIHRQTVIDELWREIDCYLKVQHYPKLNLSCHQRYFYDLLKELVEKGSISVEEWKKKSSLSILNMEPFHRATRLLDGRVVLDQDQFLAITPQDLYDWHYEIARAVIEEMR